MQDSNRAEIIATKEGLKLFEERCSRSLLVKENSLNALKWAQGGYELQWRLDHWSLLYK